MPRVHSQVAAKDYPDQGIKKGDTYYSWTFKNRVGRGTRVMSRTPPKASQLTRSEYLSQALSLQERVEALEANENLPGEVEEIIGDLRSLADEQDEKFNNMPEGLQQGDTGQLLETRRDNTNSFADELEGIDLDEFKEDEDQRDMRECEFCHGDGFTGSDEDGDKKECANCGGTGEVRDEESEPKNSDGETAEEYWQAKLDEVQACSFDIE